MPLPREYKAVIVRHPPAKEMCVCIRTAPGLGEGVMPLYWTHLVWDCSTVAFCMYLPLENTSSTDVMLYAHTAERPMLPLKEKESKRERTRKKKM